MSPSAEALAETATQGDVVRVDDGSMETTEFIVEVRYREPGYEARNESGPKPYRFRYRIKATSEANAASQALAEFRAITALSGSGWVRDVIGCDVALAA
jgi:hypothetical protein